MQLARVWTPEGSIETGLLEGDHVHLLRHADDGQVRMAEVLHSEHPTERARILRTASRKSFPADQVQFLPPVEDQEVWAAGVTYIRSKAAREAESEGAARFYDMVYTAPRPELFFKATPRRVIGPGGLVRIRQDARWSVPEPELALVVSPDLRIVGYTVGNDMSSRDIEGENPLYLPQAKVYTGSCAMGPVVTLAEFLPPASQVSIELVITRGGREAFRGATTLERMARKLPDLVEWLGRDNDFPDGVILFTGTGVVPPDDFTLASGDVVTIAVAGIGTLENRVA